MKRNIQLIFTLCITILLSAIDASAQKPNIILILADDVGYHSVGCNGSTSFSTPRIDQMAAEGTRYTQCHSAPLCSPSRFMLLTGKYNFRNYFEWGVMKPTESTIASLLKNAGYKTAVYGKWQLDGGDNSIHSLGFDQYCVHDPFNYSNDNEEIKGEQKRYKNPVLYSRGNYIDSSLTQGKYGEDIITDSILAFIEKNTSKPFFIYYPMLLSHTPFSPTPDSPEFEAWDADKPKGDPADSIYYPGMINYMDKKIGQIIDKVKSLGLAGKTYIFFTADNGTPSQITETYNGISEDGGKGSTTESGTLVPLIAWGPGKVLPTRICNGLIDFTDFMPTLAMIARTNIPSSYGVTDGKSFARSFNNPNAVLKPSIYTFFDKRSIKQPDLLLTHWAQNKDYKLYDTTASRDTISFYNIIADRNERNRLKDSELTSGEAKIKDELLNILLNYKGQGFALFDSPAIEKGITPSNVTVTSSIIKDGGNFITERGIIYDTVPNAAKTTDNSIISGEGYGKFVNSLSLDSSKNYFIRTYAVNNAGIAYSPEVKLFYKKPSPPNEIAAFDIRTSRFTIKWSPQLFADGYQVDVSRRSNFLSPTKKDSVTEAFNGGNTPPPGWTFGTGVSKNNVNYGNATPGMMFSDSASSILTNNFGNPAVSLSFWMNSKRNATGTLLLEGSDGKNWYDIDQFLQNSSAVVRTYTTGSPGWKNNFVQFRFTNKTKGSILYIDDVKTVIRASEFTGIYDSLFVNDTMVVVNNLSPNTVYFYRLRTLVGDRLSENSNRKQTRTQPATLSVHSDTLHNRVLQISVMPNPVQNNTTLTLKNASGEVNLSLFNADGVLVWTQTISSSAGHYAIDMERFKPGWYLLSARDNIDQAQLQILKQ